MKTKLFILAAFAALTLSSCDHSIVNLSSAAKQEYKAQHEYRNSKKWGKVVKKAIATKDFSSINVKGAVDVVFSQNDTLSVKAYGNEKAIEEYTFEVKDGMLYITLKDFEKNHNVTKETPAITVFINAPQLAKLEACGAGDVKLCDSIQQSCGLDIDINGAGDVDAKYLKIANLSVTIDGVGDVEIDNAECTGNAEAIINGAGEIEAEVKCANATLQINGAGNASFKAHCNELTAECNGTGDIKLKGECSKLIKSDGAVSSIDSRDLKVKKDIVFEK